MAQGQFRTTHPCGNLPVTTLNLAVHFCPLHDAHWATTYSAVQYGSEQVDVSHMKAADFSGFDNYGTVLEWINQRLIEWLNAEVAARADDA